MLKRLKKHATPATVISIIALVVALGGTAVAGGLVNKKKVNTIIDNRAPGLSVLKAKSADEAGSAKASNVFGETQGVNGSILSPGMTVDHSGNTFTSTFPRSHGRVHSPWSVASSFLGGWHSSQGPRPRTRTSHRYAARGFGHRPELVVVCPN